MGDTKKRAGEAKRRKKLTKVVFVEEEEASLSLWQCQLLRLVKHGGIRDFNNFESQQFAVFLDLSGIRIEILNISGNY